MRLMEHLPTLWMLKHRIKTESGLPLEFENHKFMWEMYNDLSPLQVWLKPPQIGATVAKILKTFWVAKKMRKDIIYTLPTATDVHDMAGGKINRLVAQNPILGEWVRDHDTVDQKSVGENIIYYRGTFSPKQAMMVSSDLNVHDEVDASDPTVITQYETRLQAKANGMRWYFSHPSLSGHGVDVFWQQSDKKEWFIICDSCQEEQVLSWPQNVSRSLRCYVCAHCKTPLSDEARKDGQWRATAEGIFSGYHVSQMMCPWITADSILNAFDDPLKDMQYFYNQVLGLPYAAADSKISAEAVLKNVYPQTNSQEGRIIIGVDTGLPIHYVCMNQEGVFYYNKCKEPTETYDPYDELRRLLRMWPKSMLVADQGGDLIGIRKLQEEFKGRVFLVFYRRDRKTSEVIRWGSGDEHGIVTVDRNRMIQLIVEQMREIGRIRLNGSPDEWQEFADHFENLYREVIVVKEQKDKDLKTLYGNEYVWKRAGPDHFVHCLLYAMVGISRYGGEKAKIVGESGFEGMATGRIFTQPSPAELAAQALPRPTQQATVVQGYTPGAFTNSNHADL